MYCTRVPQVFGHSKRSEVTCPLFACLTMTKRSHSCLNIVLLPLTPMLSLRENRGKIPFPHGALKMKVIELRPLAGSSRKRPSLLDTGVIYCGDNLDQLKKLPDTSVDLIYIDPPFNSNRNYEVFWGETKEKRAFEDRHESTQAYIEFMRPRCVEMARVLKKTGSFYYHCDWHASHYVKVMLDQIFGENKFINEVVWKRSASHNDAKRGSKHYGRN